MPPHDRFLCLYSDTVPGIAEHDGTGGAKQTAVERKREKQEIKQRRFGYVQGDIACGLYWLVLIDSLEERQALHPVGATELLA